MHSVDDEEQQARDIGRRQSLFREVNERIDEAAESFELEDEMTILCECGSRGCIQQISMTAAEYEGLRRVPTRFAVLPGHELPEVERIVERQAGFVVVEKFGESAIAAINLDPRRLPR